ncbi:MAG: two-component system LytT family response regulator [Crocinitomicaceae bacterium]|jgi:two-component system LytT family response regulator
MIRCIIVDDEINNQDALDKMIDLYIPDAKIVAKVSNIAQAKSAIEEHNPDLVFLDIEMPGGSGFELLESLEKTDFNVVFTTAHAAYAIKAIKYAAMDYLLKPLNLNELKVAVEKCVNSKTESSSLSEQIQVLKNNRQADSFKFKKIALKSSEGMEFFDTKDIIRCEADRAYCSFHLVNGKKILISKSMSEYEDMLTQGNFMKVHKSNIVNLDHIVKYVRGKGGSLIMSDKSLVNVAIRRKDALMKVIQGKVESSD